ncbi:MAG: multiheme c-type cytochrome [Terracidiphilus sp.]
MKTFFRFAAISLGTAALLAVGGTFGASYYYTSQYGQGCASCHEMAAYVSVVHSAPHRTTGCMDCHEASLATKLRHMWVHNFGEVPEAIRLRDVDVPEMTASCKTCHQHEYANWHAGPHSVTYSQIFTDSAHNSKRMLMDDCLRCHGMFFSGAIGGLVQPLNTKGPWKVIRAGLGDQPAMPCMACHQMHREGAQESRPDGRISVAGPAVPESLAFYDRRETLHFAAVSLAIPQMYDGARPVTVSQDPRQSLCYQCHAPRQPETGSVAAAHGWGPQVGSGDDRTPMGVHEGISCVACHNDHNENTLASCKNCHPQMSNCGLDVEKMDTTYANSASVHNIHWVKCTDCHQHGIPKVTGKKDQGTGIRDQKKQPG